MSRLVLILKRLLVAAILVALTYVLYEPTWSAMKWIAWNWIRVDFVATCRVFEYDQTDDPNDFEFLDGPYSGEFLREVVTQWPETYPDIDLGIDDDGTLTVPLGFYLPVDPYWSKFGGNPEMEERGFSISAGAAYQIFQRRLAEGIDMAPYKQYEERVERWQKEDQPRRLKAPVCGFMDELARKDGSLARP